MNNVISIIIPTFRPGNYLYKCLESINKQTIPKSFFDVKIILNGQKEPYYSEILLFISNNPQLKIDLCYSTLKGVSIARNLGIENSLNYKYIVFVDDDDFLSPTFIEHLYNPASLNNYDIVQSNFKNIVEGTIEEDYISNAYKRNLNVTFGLLKYRKFFSSVCGKIFDNKIIGNTRFIPEIKMAEDAVFMFTLSKNITSFKFAHTDCVYFRNVRKGSALNSYRPFAEIISDYLKNLYFFSKVYINQPLRYNFLFYITRILAVTKYLFYELYVFSKKIGNFN